ncbi:MAG: hypothetical protein KBC16_00725 [Candidatus Pacebacteria bacterium]|nr:hypothetical protein [Candidatus Paceibacterota bacterium]
MLFEVFFRLLDDEKTFFSPFANFSDEPFRFETEFGAPSFHGVLPISSARGESSLSSGDIAL